MKQLVVSIGTSSDFIKLASQTTVKIIVCHESIFESPIHKKINNNNNKSMEKKTRSEFYNTSWLLTILAQVQLSCTTLPNKQYFLRPNHGY